MGANLQFFPLRRTVSTYNKDTLLHDMRAGLNVALVAIPQGLAYASIAGLPIRWGVYSSAIAAMISPFLTTSRHTMLGPTNATSVMIASSFGLGVASSLDREAQMPLLLMMVAIFLVAGAVLKLAGLIQYLSRSVLVGYITGAAILIIGKQASKTIGVGLEDPVTGEAPQTFFAIIWETILKIPESHWPTVFISIATGLIYFGLSKKFRWLPNVAITLVLASGLAFALKQAELNGVEWLEGFEGIALFTGYELGFASWHFTPPKVDFNAINLMFGPALAIAFLASLENNVMAKTIASRSGDPVNNNQEMLSVGVANFFCSLFSGQPASGSLTRSALNFSSGAMTQFASLFCGGLCFLAAISIGPLVGYVPKAVLSVLVISIALSLFNKRNIKICLKTTKSDGSVLLITTFSALITTLDVAIFVGVATSIILYLRKAARPSMVEYEFDESGTLAEKEEEKARQIPEISIVHVEGDLFFGAAEVFREQILRIAGEPNLKVIILRLRNARHLDATSVMSLEDLYNFMERKECALIVSGVRRDVYRVLKNSGLVEVIGRENIFMGSPTNPNLSTRNALIRAQEVLGGKEAEIRIFYNPKKQEQDDDRSQKRKPEDKPKDRKPAEKKDGSTDDPKAPPAREGEIPDEEGTDVGKKKS